MRFRPTSKPEAQGTPALSGMKFTRIDGFFDHVFATKTQVWGTAMIMDVQTDVVGGESEHTCVEWDDAYIHPK